MKVFLYDKMMSTLEDWRLSQIREYLVKSAQGNILEIGAGTGVNFKYYSHHRVTAIEPDAEMRAEAVRKVGDRDIEVIDASAEEIPAEDNTYDTVIVTLAFCTIPDPQAALREIKRVCRPGGHLLILEHIRNERRSLAVLQDILTPLWKRFAMGCHLNRDTLSLIKEMEFEEEELDYLLGKNFVYGGYTNIK